MAIFVARLGILARELAVLYSSEGRAWFGAIAEELERRVRQ